MNDEFEQELSDLIDFALEDDESEACEKIRANIKEMADYIRFIESCLTNILDIGSTMGMDQAQTLFSVAKMAVKDTGIDGSTLRVGRVNRDGTI